MNLTLYEFWRKSQDKLDKNSCIDPEDHRLDNWTGVTFLTVSKCLFGKRVVF